MMLNENNQSDIEIVVWDEKYSTGIHLIDTQHKQLIDITNQLYARCLKKDDVLEAAFKDTMSHMVEYVKFHFNAELKMLRAVNFPDFHNHKKQHDSMIQNILAAAKEYNEGKKFVPNNFVRTLRDWILSHIAVYDKAYGFYIFEQIKNGTMTEKDLKEIEKSAV